MLPAPSVTTRSPGARARAGAPSTRSRSASEAHVAMAVRAHRLGERRGLDAGDLVLAGGVDVRQHEHVGVVEGAREVVEEIARARVAVRLEGDHDAAGVHLARGGERRADLGRVVAVVVDHAHAARPRPCSRSAARRRRSSRAPPRRRRTGPRARARPRASASAFCTLWRPAQRQRRARRAPRRAGARAKRVPAAFDCDVRSRTSRPAATKP